MRRYTLQELYTMAEFNQLGQQIYHDYEAVAMNDSSSGLYNNTISFVMSAVYGYFYGDLVAYAGDSKNEVKGKLYHRLGLDISIKLAYWYKKYTQIKKLLTTEDLSLLQTSKMTSSSSDTTHSAGGTLQKTATTPTGVSADSSADEIDISLGSGDESANEIDTNGFADKYSNAQQKFANAMASKGERSGEILREGSIDDLLKVLEKLPSSFATEVQKDLQKHFIFDYDGEFEDLYDFMEGDFSGMIIGKTRTNQPVEKVEGFDTAIQDYLNGDEVEVPVGKVEGFDDAVQDYLDGDDATLPLEKIEDADGNKRFIEGDGTPSGIEGITSVFCKWSLSGTHLMFVYAGTAEQGTEIAGQANLCSFEVPSWVASKLYPMFSDVLELKGYDFFGNDFTKDTKNVFTLKSTNTIIFRYGSSIAYTLDKDRNFRISADFLIDNE